jgi:hypothetical protein
MEFRRQILQLKIRGNELARLAQELSARLDELWTNWEEYREHEKLQTKQVSTTNKPTDS